MSKATQLLTVAATAVLGSLGSTARADELEVAFDSSWIDTGTFNQEFSGNAGFAVGYTATLGNYAYAAFWTRNGLADFASDEDRELDIGAGIAFPLGDSGVSVDLYAGRWMYGEELDRGDDIVTLGISGGPFKGTATRLSGETDATAYRAELAFATLPHLDLVPSVAFVDYDDAKSEVNYGLSARYAFAEGWQAEAVAVWQDGADPAVGLRLSWNFEWN